jgi:phosphate transport system permease protein
VFVAVVVALVVSLVWQAAPAFRHSGFSFIFSGTWNPDTEQFGAGVFIIDTLITTGHRPAHRHPRGHRNRRRTVGVPAPAAGGAPLHLRRPAGGRPEHRRRPVGPCWSSFPSSSATSSPSCRRSRCSSTSSAAGISGSGILLASVVLAVMMLPTMVALTRTALQGVSVADREAALALGGTHWQVVRRAVIPGARSGIQAAITLAMGRALGEAIAVALVIGGGVTLPHSLLANGTTLGSAVVSFFSEAIGVQRSAVIGLVVILLAFTAVANIGGQLLPSGTSLEATPLPVPDDLIADTEAAPA